MKIPKIKFLIKPINLILTFYPMVLLTSNLYVKTDNFSYYNAENILNNCKWTSNKKDQLNRFQEKVFCYEDRGDAYTIFEVTRYIRSKKNRLTLKYIGKLNHANLLEKSNKGRDHDLLVYLKLYRKKIYKYSCVRYKCIDYHSNYESIAVPNFFWTTI
tara:strand:+ start:409 stop:882 length:474 start_codon:yes stop_codon:yes gene_type:complete